MLNSYMINSIKGFNGSQNSDRTNENTFAESYIKRKEEIINNKLHVFKKNPVTVNAPKLAFEIKLLKEFKDNLPEIKEFVKQILREEKTASAVINSYITEKKDKSEKSN